MNLLGEYSSQQACLNLHNKVIDAKEASNREARNILKEYESTQCLARQRIHSQLDHQK